MTPVPIKQEAGRAPEPVWKIRKRERSLAPAGILNPARPARIRQSKNCNMCDSFLPPTFICGLEYTRTYIHETYYVVRNVDAV